MLRRILLTASAVLGLAAPLRVAQAQPTTNVPGLSVSFAQPTGTGTPTSSFDVVIRLALAPNADPFTFNGLDPADNFLLPANFPFPSQGQSIFQSGVMEMFAAYTSANLNNGFDCENSSFLNNCSPGGPYTLQFNFAPPSLVGLTMFSLAPGTFMDFLFGTFVPNGPVPPGTYTFFNVVPVVQFFGVAENGDPLEQDVALASTCENMLLSCAFTRTVTSDVVTATPEPATVGLMAMGVAAVGLLRRRRRRLAAA